MVTDTETEPESGADGGHPVQWESSNKQISTSAWPGPFGLFAAVDSACFFLSQNPGLRARGI